MGVSSASAKLKEGHGRRSYRGNVSSKNGDSSPACPDEDTRRIGGLRGSGGSAESGGGDWGPPFIMEGSSRTLCIVGVKSRLRRALRSKAISASCLVEKRVEHSPLRNKGSLDTLWSTVSTPFFPTAEASPRTLELRPSRVLLLQLRLRVFELLLVRKFSPSFEISFKLFLLLSFDSGQACLLIPETTELASAHGQSRESENLTDKDLYLR